MSTNQDKMSKQRVVDRYGFSQSMKMKSIRTTLYSGQQQRFGRAKIPVTKNQVRIFVCISSYSVYSNYFISIQLQTLLIMIITDLEIPNFQEGHHPPKRKTEYAAGFRGYHKNNNNQKVSNEHAEIEVEQYLEMIGGSNMAALYHKQKKEEQKRLNNYAEKQIEATNKLYKNLYQKKENKDEDKVTQNSEESSKYLSLERDSLFQQRRVEIYLTRKLIKKIHSKLFSHYRHHCKNKENFIKFWSIMLGFALSEPFHFGEIISQEQFLTNLFKNHLLTNQQILHTKYQKCSLSIDAVINLKNKSRFFYSFFQELQDLTEQTIWINGTTYVKLESELIKKQEIIDLQKWSEQIVISNIFQPLSNSFTVPYQIGFKKQTPKIQKQQSNEEETKQMKYVFKANKIPQSTYVEPRKKSINKAKSIVPQPFNLAETHKKTTPEQYYFWDTNFKANQIPKTTYHPQKISVLNEKEKKAQAVLSLQKASYPKTMEYLQNYPEVSNNKRNNIAEKYRKQPIHPEIHQVPNFEHLHAKQLVLLQQTMQKNKKNIEPRPFNLSKNREKNNMTSDMIIPASKNENRKKSSQNFSIPLKSTKKYDAYVEKKKKEEMLQKDKQLQAKKQQKKKEDKAKNLGKILKERMREELEAHPMENPLYEPNRSVKLKVDYEKIYREKPLLMKSSLPEKEIDLPWQPIFSHLQ